FFSAHEVSTCKISGCLSYRILDSGPDGTQTTLTEVTDRYTKEKYFEYSHDGKLMGRLLIPSNPENHE
ncbi:hypothetical protein EA154_13360, partial [Enterobacter hormaechei subsp. hoffmannii]